MAAKAALFIFWKRAALSGAAKTSIPFLVCLIASETISSVINGVELLQTVRIYLFCANILLTLNFVNTSYWRGLLCTSLVNAVLFILASQAGALSSHFGRLYYFSDSHPNLGSELFFAGAYAGLQSKLPKTSVCSVLLFFACTFLMQGRAAEIGILAILLILAWRSSQHLGLKIFLILATVAIFLITLLVADLSSILDKVLLLDDQYRGGDSNASGRLQYWQSAIDVWIDHPLFGAGTDYSDRLGVLKAHNFFLYALANYGFLGVVTVGIFIYQLFYVALLKDWMLLVPFVPMLAFNDRFINLNTYPTVMFLFVFIQFHAAVSERYKSPRLPARQRGPISYQ
nr:O-antigen ligase family protein [Bradyrhizobium sp. CW10]